MSRTVHRPVIAALCAGAVAFAGWMTMPGTSLDLAAFTTVARGFANPPFFVSGNGGHASPWELRTFATLSEADERQAPLIVSLGDDIEGFFQSSPPSPIDLAVVFDNFQRLGATRSATAAVLAWDSPDPIGLMALEKAIGRFDSLVMAAPLSRASTPEPMPPAFRRASLPFDLVQGETSALPVVNRIALKGVILGNDNTLAGFQSLDSEQETSRPALMARWDDRVVFAFPLLIALHRLGLPLDQMEMIVGEYLKLGPEGPIIPIDSFGRMTLPRKPVSPYAEISAELLIDGDEGLFPKQAPSPAILRDDRSTADPGTRSFSKSLSSIIAALSSDTFLSSPQPYPRLKSKTELGLLAFLTLLLAGTSSLPRFARNTALLTLAGTCIAAQCIAAGLANIWMPGAPALAAVAATFALSCITRSGNPQPLSAPASAAAKPPVSPKGSSAQPERTAPPEEPRAPIPQARKKAPKPRKKRRH